MGTAGINFVYSKWCFPCQAKHVYRCWAIEPACWQVCKTIPTFWDFLYKWREEQNSKHLLLQLKRKDLLITRAAMDCSQVAREREEGYLLSTRSILTLLSFGQFWGTWQNHWSSYILIIIIDFFQFGRDLKDHLVLVGKSTVWTRWPIILSSWILSVHCWGIHHFPHNGEIIAMANCSHCEKFSSCVRLESSQA